MVASVTEKYDNTATTNTEITFAGSIYGVDINLGKFIKDLELMDTIRNSHDPAIKDAFEGLLTTMALVNGRNANEVPVMDDP